MAGTSLPKLQCELACPGRRGVAVSSARPARPPRPSRLPSLLNSIHHPPTGPRATPPASYIKLTRCPPRARRPPRPHPIIRLPRPRRNHLTYALPRAGQGYRVSTTFFPTLVSLEQLEQIIEIYLVCSSTHLHAHECRACARARGARGRAWPQAAPRAMCRPTVTSGRASRVTTQPPASPPCLPRHRRRPPRRETNRPPPVTHKPTQRRPTPPRIRFETAYQYI